MIELLHSQPKPELLLYLCPLRAATPRAAGGPDAQEVSDEAAYRDEAGQAEIPEMDLIRIFPMNVGGWGQFWWTWVNKGLP